MTSLQDYVEKVDKFQEWMSMIEKSGVRMLNEINLIKWNLNKNYMSELESSGVEIVPTLFISQDGADKKTLLQYVEQAIADNKFNKSVVKFVMKPCVGASAYGAHIFSLDGWQSKQSEFDSLLEQSDMMIQPFVETIKTEGETSFLFFNGSFSHSIIKRPSSNDFRVQEQYGGSIILNSPSQADIDIAKGIMNHISAKSKTLYARVDMVSTFLPFAIDTNIKD
eukprot:gene12810-15032_t